MRPSQTSLMVPLTIAIVVITTVVLTGFGIWNYYGDMASRQLRLEESLKNTTHRLALNISLPLYNLDPKTIEKIIISELQRLDIVSIHYYESWTELTFGFMREKNTVVPSDTVPILPDTITEKQPIRFNDQELGQVTVIVTLDLMKEELQNELFADIIQMIIVDIALVILVILTLRFRILRPIQSLTISATEIAKGNLDMEISVSGKDEIGILARSFSIMRNAIKAQIKDLQTENTNRKKAEDALRESEEKYRNVIDNSMEAICIQQEGILKYFNPETIDLFGYAKSELGQIEIENLVYPEDRVIAMDHYLKTASGASTDQRQTYRIVNKSGDIIWIENKAVAISWENNPAILMFISDVTERKRTEELIIQTEKMMSIGGLAAGMAHEINNPLSAILQGTQNIIRRLSPDFAKNKQIARELGIDLEILTRYLESREIPSYLEGIQSSGKRAADIISNMLQFSRKSESTVVETNIVELVDNTIELARKEFDLEKKYDFKKIKIIKSYNPTDKTLVVPCTQTEIEQVILNLLKNAAQALNKSQQPDPQITVKIFKDTTNLWIQLTDNGPGIDKAMKKRVFEPFYTTKPVGEGTGLGLSVSYMIITNNHQGTLEVESELGEGSSFIISLPLNRHPTLD